MDELIRTINDFIANRSDEGRSLPWLEAEFDTRRGSKQATVEHIAKVLLATGDITYGKTFVEVCNSIDDTMNLYCAGGMDKAYVTGFMDALDLIK